MRSFDDAATRTPSSASESSEAGGGEVEELDAPDGEHGEEVDDVEVGDERVGDVDERPRQQISDSGHPDAPPSLGRWSIRSRRSITIACNDVDRSLRSVGNRAEQHQGIATEMSSCSDTIPAAWCTSARSAGDRRGHRVRRRGRAACTRRQPWVTQPGRPASRRSSSARGRAGPGGGGRRSSAPRLAPRDPEREREHGGMPFSDRGGTERRPPRRAGRGRGRARHDRPAGACARRSPGLRPARTGGPRAGRPAVGTPDRAEVAVVVDEHDPGPVDLEQLDAGRRTVCRLDARVGGRVGPSRSRARPRSGGRAVGLHDATPGRVAHHRGLEQCMDTYVRTGDDAASPDAYRTDASYRSSVPRPAAPVGEWPPRSWPEPHVTAPDPGGVRTTPCEDCMRSDVLGAACRTPGRRSRRRGDRWTQHARQPERYRQVLTAIVAIGPPVARGS